MKRSKLSFILFIWYGISTIVSIAAQEFFGGLAHILAGRILYTAPKGTRKKMLTTGIDKEVIFFFIACLLGLFWNGCDYLRFDLFSQFRWVLLFYSLYLCVSELKLTEDPFRVVIPFMVLTLALGAYSYVQRTYGLDLAHGGQGKVQVLNKYLYRAVGTFSNPITFGNSMSMAGSFIFAYVINLPMKDRAYKVLAVLSFVAAIMAVGFSYTRGAYVGLSCGVIAVAMFSSKKTAKFIFMMGVVLIFGVFFIDSDLTLRMRSIFSPTQSSITRMYIWSANLAMFRDHWLFGVGYNYNTYAIMPYYKALNIPPQYWANSHAHNNLIQFLGGTGITGTLAYLLFTFKVFKLNISTLKTAVCVNPFSKSLILGFMGLHVAFFTSGFTEATFRDSELRNLFIFFLVFFLAMRNRATVTQ